MNQVQTIFETLKDKEDLVEKDILIEIILD